MARASYGAVAGFWLILRRSGRRRAPGSVPGRGAPAAARRGTPRLVSDTERRLRCVACTLCAAACPTRCITLEAGPPPWLDEPESTATSTRSPVRFDLDLGRCLLCGLCQAACPEEAITLSDTLAAPVTGQRQSLHLDLKALGPS